MSKLTPEQERILKIGLANNRVGLEIANEIAGERTDGQLMIPMSPVAVSGGTYTATVNTAQGIVSLARTASPTDDEVWFDVPVPNRTKSGRGIAPTGIRANIGVATSTLDELRVELWKITLGANGVTPTGAVLIGGVNGHYEAAYDTAGERGAVGEKLITTSSAGTYIASNEILRARVYTESSIATSALVVREMVLLYNHTP